MNSSELVFTGYVYRIRFDISGEKLLTKYFVSTLETYKGKNEGQQITDVESGTDDYDVIEQFRLLNRAGITERKVYKNLITPEINKIYIFATNDYYESSWCTVKNPAQYAFCIDDSNAPGGVNYSKMREYLLKNYEMQETPIKKYFMED